MTFLFFFFLCIVVSRSIPYTYLLTDVRSLHDSSYCTTVALSSTAIRIVPSSENAHWRTNEFAYRPLFGGWTTQHAFAGKSPRLNMLTIPCFKWHTTQLVQKVASETVDTSLQNATLCQKRIVTYLVVPTCDEPARTIHRKPDKPDVAHIQHVLFQ